MESLRATIMTQAEGLNTRRRFGLFSQPTTIALGDNSLYPSKTARKGEDGKTATLPRNMLAGPNRSGVTKKDFLTPVSTVNTDDKYLDPQKVDYLYEQKFHGKSKLHDHNYKPNNWPKSLTGSTYKHIDENPVEKKKPSRDDTGRVVTKDKNVTSNPQSKINKDLFKAPKHIIDPFERKDQIAAQERRINDAKKGDEVFRSMSHGSLCFGTDRQTFGVDQSAEELLKKKKMYRDPAPRVYKHETQFKLARGGHGHTINKFPEYLPQTNSETLKARKSEKGDREDWKPNGNKSLSRPTPSISYSSFNLRRRT